MVDHNHRSDVNSLRDNHSNQGDSSNTINKQLPATTSIQPALSSRPTSSYRHESKRPRGRDRVYHNNKRRPSGEENISNLL